MTTNENTKVETLQVGQTIEGVGLFIRGTVTAIGDLIPVYRQPGVFARVVTCQRAPGSWTTTAIRDGQFRYTAGQ